MFVLCLGLRLWLFDCLGEDEIWGFGEASLFFLMYPVSFFVGSSCWIEVDLSPLPFVCAGAV